MKAFLMFLFTFFLPCRWRTYCYSVFYKGFVDPSSRIGRSYISVQYLRLEAGAKISSFSIIRNLECLIMESNSRIGTFNWIYGFVIENSSHFVEEIARKSILLLKRESSLTSRHIIDCTNSVEIGEFSTIAGFYTQILTHGIDIYHNIQSSKPVIIGSYCMVGSGSIITKGSVLPKGTILAAGSVFRWSPSDEYCLYSGVPAECVKRLDENSKYYLRDKGSVD
jgi:acetyltransferase-like isoleucine patch superfamily enzyme